MRKRRSFIFTISLFMLLMLLCAPVSAKTSKMVGFRFNEKKYTKTGDEIGFDYFADFYPSSAWNVDLSKAPYVSTTMLIPNKMLQKNNLFEIRASIACFKDKEKTIGPWVNAPDGCIKVAVSKNGKVSAKYVGKGKAKVSISAGKKFAVLSIKKLPFMNTFLNGMPESKKVYYNLTFAFGGENKKLTKAAKAYIYIGDAKLVLANKTVNFKIKNNFPWTARYFYNGQQQKSPKIVIKNMTY